MTSEPNAPGPTKGAASEPPWVNAQPRHLVERFVLGPELGRGGMGRVHLGWDPMLRRMVAIKLLLGDDPELHLRLLREARNQAKIEHPNICRIHDLGMSEARPYIAMQLILGSSLSELRPELDHREIAELLADIAGAVHAAHKVGLIHRDLKPANILVTGRGLGRKPGSAEKDLLASGGIPRLGRLKPYVVDFGLARDLQALDQTLSWSVMGTPAFMSPEQARGEALGPATDIYSLGATLYAMLSGQPPFEGSTLAGLITQQSEHGARAVRRLDPKVPKDLETITLKCLETEPAKRYASAGALEEDLRRWLAGKPIVARPVGPAGRLVRWARRKPTLAATASAGLAATLLLAGWNLHTTRQASRREAAAQRFALEIRDAEHLLRIERMMPIHDIRPAEARLRRRMDEIRAMMATLGGIARGPGLYALGRGHLALRQYPVAIEVLDAAWSAGFQAPEVAYARALARLKLFEEKAIDFYGLMLRPEDLAKARTDLVLPALRHLRDAKGARVDHPDYGYALAAWGSDRFEEAENGFSESLSQAPWLAEAWVGRFRNRMRWKWSEATTPRQIAALGAELEPMLEEAERLAPSDDDPLVAHVRFKHSHFIRLSAINDRSERPLAEAMGLTEKARRIRPESTVLISLNQDVSIQRGFFQLGSGKDPGPMMREVARLVEAGLARSDWPRAQDRENVRLGLHHVWLIAAEADWRFGRDPRPAIAQAAAIRPHFAREDAHFVYVDLTQARHLIGLGLDPQPVFRSADRILHAPQTQLDAFHGSILGELYLEWAAWLHAQGRPADAKAAEAIAVLERGAREVPGFAYTYYTLAPLHALRARIALDQGKDPALHLQAAVAAAEKGLKANPRNAMIRLAAAQAHHAVGLARSARGEDPGPALDRVRDHLKQAETVNPKDFRIFLLRAETERLAAEAARTSGNDPSRHRELCRQAARQGLKAKPDEPRFRVFLGRPEPAAP